MRYVFQRQLTPILLAIITFLALVGVLFVFILFLNLLPTKDKIIPLLRISDILVGLTIYLKTSIDFALFIGNIMKQYPGTKNRIAIEFGTALGNGLGTLLVLTIWTFFREVLILMILMIILASLVLLKMAEESLQELHEEKQTPPSPVIHLVRVMFFVLQKINLVFSPLTSILLPHPTQKKQIAASFASLFLFSFSIPFILGLDDFAGYIPLFSIINVFGFATGAFLGHMALTVSLFASPKMAVRIVRLPIIATVGAFAFIIIAGIGFFEASRIAHIYFFPR